MNKTDHTGLNATLLETLVTVYQESSVSRAADRLMISQSTLSHRLDRLRTIFEDPLFVRKGRGIGPTGFLDSKIQEIIAVTADLQALMISGELDVAALEGEISIATSDYERSVLLFDACREVQKKAPGLSFRFKWEQFDNSDALRSGVFDIAMAPYSGLEGSSEIRHKKLFRDTLVCFYEADRLPAPKTLEDYLARDHISVMLSESDQSFIDRSLQILGVQRRRKFIVPCISEVAPLLRDSDLLVTLPSAIETTLMQGFASSTPPLDLPAVDVAMFWHTSTDTSPMHKWIRQELTKTAERVQIRSRVSGLRAAS